MGFPLERLEIKALVKNILNRKGIKSKKFKDNTPGNDWLKNFIWRNKLSARLSSNIKRARASVDKAAIEEFFEELQETVQGVSLPCSNILNDDETNLSDDPGKKCVIVRRGRRHVENVREHSKTSISIIWCGSAAGSLL